MKPGLLEYLICPMCKNQLEFKEFQKEKIDSWIEISEGVFECNCGELYPIIGGVPRFLVGKLKAELLVRYPKFFEKHPELSSRVLSLSGLDQDRFSQIKASVINRFGYEWTTWGDYDADNFLDKIYPVQPDSFKNKLGLEAGCGAGRHTRQAVLFGAEVIAIDLSWGVESAYKNTRDLQLAHILQADIFNLPLRPKSFDFVFSLGVLQVTADPPAGFSNLIRYLKPNAPILTWTSSSKRKITLFFLSLARIITTRLPNRVVKWTSFFAAIIDYGFFIGPYKILKKVPGLGRMVEKIPFPRIKGYAKYNFRIIYVDWFDRLTHPTVKDYSYEEIKSWHERNNLYDVRITPDGYHAWITFGRTR